MQEYKVWVRVPGQEEPLALSMDKGSRLRAAAEQVQEAFDAPIILSQVDGKLKELNKKIKKDCRLSFLTIRDRDGDRVYRRSLIFLLQRAIMNLYGEDALLKVKHSLGDGYYCEIWWREPGSCPAADAGGLSERKLLRTTQNELSHIRTAMEQLQEKDLPIEKKQISTKKAERYFAKHEMPDKERLLHYRRSSLTNVYELDGCLDYFYGYMAPSTGMLKWYDLMAYEDGFLLLFPNRNSGKLEPFETYDKLFGTLEASRSWSRSLGVGTIGALNDAIAQGKGQELILLQEALMEAKLGELAATIASDPKKKFIMVAGPSSSGKTSFANRLSIQLRAKGITPHPISLDDYYVNRVDTPKHPDGTYDFECLEALDIELFNRQMLALLQGEEVALPTYNFKTGLREYRGNRLQLGAGDVLVIEGIHGLNDRLSYSLPAESKYRIYISALSQLNIDEHNPLPTTDGRLLRRMVRDARTRGTSARATIAMWPSVRMGEEKNIFPYQESADVMFNSALVYELAVLKVYAEPLLFQIKEEDEEYPEAQRLLKFLDYLLPLPVEGINHNSLLREFVGGSCFNV